MGGRDVDRIAHDKILAQAAQEAGCGEEQARRLMDALVGEVRKHLLAGNAVELKDIGLLEVAEREARIVSDAVTGQRMISPARRFVTLEPTAQMSALVQKTKTSAILLAAPRRGAFTKVIELHFSRLGWKVGVAATVEECREMLDPDLYYLVILDASLAGWPELVREVKCSRATSFIPVIVLFPKGSIPDRPDDLVVSGDEHLVEPFEIDALLGTAQEALARASEEHLLFGIQVAFSFPSRRACIEGAYSLVSDLFAASGLDEKGQVAAGAAFREAVANAVQHGNRDDETKQVQALYLQDAEKVTMVVSDEGPGFDHKGFRSRPAGRDDIIQIARERFEGGKPGGLGMILMEKCVDKMEYNGRGNEVTLQKYLQAARERMAV
jgi:serine/threonine-protein kinase RsbW